MSGRPETAGEIEVRRARADDLDGVLELARQSLGWVGGPDDARFFQWKHQENPFGPSPMWVATSEGRVVGFRAFLRWRFHDRDGGAIEAVRAVDTATHPDFQGRGIFTRLTLGALDELRDDGIAMVFNTPNDRSLPGYLKMGWSLVGRLPTTVMLTRRSSPRRLWTARGPASLWSIDTSVGRPAHEVFADHDAVRALLASCPPRDGISTARSPEFLAWRYGFEDLRYRVLLAGSSVLDGIAVFRLRRRGKSVECVDCQALLPSPYRQNAEGRLLRRIARETTTTFVIRLGQPVAAPGPFLPVPRLGPTLVCRPLKDSPPPALGEWNLTLGDIELL